MPTLVRFDPARELTTLQHEVNRLFNTVWGDVPAQAGATGERRRWVPAMDLAETADAFVLRTDLPGVAEEDVAIELDGDVLTISGKRESVRTEEGENVHRTERSYGAFQRSLTLPEGVEAEAITASFERGVLEVRIPKPEQKKPRRVEISVGGRPETIEGGEPKDAA
jgi:HSP20 family protein